MKQTRGRSDDLVSWRRSPVCKCASSLPAASLPPPPRSPSDAQPSLPRSGHACPGPWCWPVGAQHPFIRGAPFQHSIAMPGRKDPRWDLSRGCRGKPLSTSCYMGSANLQLRTAWSSAPGERSCSWKRAGQPRGALPAHLSMWLCLTLVLPPVPTYGSREFPFSFKVLWVVVL